MRIRFSLLITLVIAIVLVVSVMQTSLVRADDATPPEDTTEPPPQESTGEEAPEEQGEQPTEVAPEEQDEQPTEVAPEEQGEQHCEVASEEQGEQHCEVASEEQSEQAGEEESENQNLPEILDQAPPDTEIVVLDKNGEVQELATEEALEILLNGDPIWCPAVSPPIAGAGGCTAGATSFATLLSQLNSGDTGAGVIWVQDTYNAANDSAPIEFDGSTTDLSNLTDLTVQGGWDGGAAGTITGTSTLDDAFSIVNWQGDVTLNNLIFSAVDLSAVINLDAALSVQTDGNILLDDVTITNTDDGTGAYLDTCDYNNVTEECAGTGNITVQNSQFSDNDFDGLVTDSGGDTDLDTVLVDNNDLMGAYITGADDNGTGNVTIQDSTFNNHNNGTGLDVYSDGNITLTDVVANNNFTGMVLDTTPGPPGSTITVVGVVNSEANDNDGTGLHATSDGGITISQFNAERNDANGAYLVATGTTGNILVDTNSFFGENGNYGLFAMTHGGDITLDTIGEDGNSVTKTGAFLKTLNGGTVLVDTSNFDNNTLSGLVIASSGQVDLDTVTANNNGRHGVEVYSTYTYCCRGANNITVNVDAGTFANNAFYGLYVAPGASGTLVFVNPATFVPANGSGDYQLVLTDPDCSEPVQKPSSKKDVKSVKVPFTDGPFVEQDCVSYSGTKLVLPNGTYVMVGCPYTGETQLEGLEQVNLPGPLGAGGTFVGGISVKFESGGLPVEELTEGGLLTLSFEIPVDARGRRYSILFWDPDANGGLGAWIQLPPYEFGTSFKLNPDDPTDGRTIFSGVQQKGNTVVVTVDFPGDFVLVSE
jgi:hypothetical protein